MLLHTSHDSPPRVMAAFLCQDDEVHGARGTVVGRDVSCLLRSATSKPLKHAASRRPGRIVLFCSSVALRLQAGCVVIVLLVFIMNLELDANYLLPPGSPTFNLAGQ